MLFCAECNSSFNKKIYNQIYCSRICKNKNVARKRYVKLKLIKNNVCLYCNSLTNNKKYCSKDCANLALGQLKIKKEYKCVYCNELIKIGWPAPSKYCTKCKYDSTINKNYVDWSKITLEEYRKSSKNTHQYHARIRSLARSSFKKAKKCQICEYNTYVEICHIKAIKDFDMSTPISIVNDSSNLVCLCPNHHKEFDLGLIQL